MPAPSDTIPGAPPPGTTKKAYLEVVLPATSDQVRLCFNPTEFQIAKQNTFAEVAIPGLMAPPIQYVRGASEKLTFEAIADTSDDMSDVRKAYVDPIRNLMNIDPAIHAPPVVKLVWGPQAFTGVIESLNTTYTLFSDTGVPVRAKLAVALKQYATIAQQFGDNKNESADVEKSYVVQRTDTLSSIAEQAYGDPAQWRAIARANAITDPRTIEPGRTLTIPRLVAETT
jgi:nucleoid-associated protein YgaU